MAAIAREAEMRKTEVETALSTLYLGGGTPGMLPPILLQELFDALHSTFNVNEDAEITLEANPDDVTKEKLHFWKDLGINRLSVGIQSFADPHLKWMNRVHSAERGARSIAGIREAGFVNFTIDLIYGIPGMTEAEWEKNLKTAVASGTPHISAYCLTVEPGTALGHRVAKGREKPVDENLAADQFVFMTEFLKTAGYHRYEVSNFAKPGFESRHNSAYWEGTPFVALGPSAHGFNGNERYFNVANNVRYCQSIERGELPETRERLSAESKFNEWVMTGLRTARGINLNDARKIHGIDLEEMQGDKIKRLVDAGLAHRQHDRLVLSEKGMFLADGIASDFFILEREDQN
jgi:oxygen-independent coproporphyrinogen-3 oxidase